MSSDIPNAQQDLYDGSQTHTEQTGADELRQKHVVSLSAHGLGNQDRNCDGSPYDTQYHLCIVYKDVICQGIDDL